MFRLVLLFGLLTFATSLVVSCANEVPETDIPSERFESIIQEVLDYGPPLREATANPRGDTLHLTITVEYGTGEKLTNGILDYAFWCNGGSGGGGRLSLGDQHSISGWADNRKRARRPPRNVRQAIRRGTECFATGCFLECWYSPSPAPVNLPCAVLIGFWSHWPPTYQWDGRRFFEVDLAGDPVAAAEELNRNLSRERIASGQAARSAERTLRDRTRDTVTRQAVLDGWRQVVLGLQGGLVELIATAAEQRTGYRPEVRQVRRVLTESRAELLPTAEYQPGPASAGDGNSRRRPASFTFLSETRSVSSWSDLLMRRRHPEDFERILEIRRRTNPYFSRSAEDLYVPKPVGDAGIYASCQGARSLIEQRARRVVEWFGYPADSLTVQTR